MLEYKPLCVHVLISLDKSLEVEMLGHISVGFS